MSTLLNKIGLGTVQFGTDYGISNHNGKTTVGEVEKTLRCAKKYGVHYLDTAYAYGDSEEVLGNFDLSSFRIVSKYIPKDDVLIEMQLERSLERLNVNYLYGYLAHRPLDLLVNNYKNLKLLESFKEKGLVEKIGASFNSVEEIDVFFKKDISLDIVQVPYNYLDKRFENKMKELKAKGCEIHTRSAFLQGLFFCNLEKLPAFFDEVKPVLKQLQDQHLLSVQLLKFVLEKEFVDVVNIGVNNSEQFIQNLESIQEVILTLPKLESNINSKILMPSEWPQIKQ